MKTFFKTDTGIRILFPMSYLASVAPLFALVYGGFWAYAVALLFYGAVLILLYHINIMVPGIALALSSLEPRYAQIGRYLSGIYPLAFFLGTPMVFSAFFQSGVAGDPGRDLDPLIGAFPWPGISLLVILDLVYTFVWVRRVRASR